MYPTADVRGRPVCPCSQSPCLPSLVTLTLRVPGARTLHDFLLNSLLQPSRKQYQNSTFRPRPLQLSQPANRTTALLNSATTASSRGCRGVHGPITSQPKHNASLTILDWLSVNCYQLTPPRHQLRHHHRHIDPDISTSSQSQHN